MSRVKGRDTLPERQVRSLLFRLGYRFRLHSKKLPGKPDIILPRFRKVIFVHGCFWHSHAGCNRAIRPKTNEEFWQQKLDDNVNRDAKILSELRRLGWQPLVIWQCEIRDAESLEITLENFFAESVKQLCHQ